MNKLKDIFIILFGAQASGKGSQARLLEKELHIKHISSGRLLRLRAKKDKKIAKQLENGEFIKDEIINKVIFDYIKINKYNSVILDGYPRNLEQKKYLHQYLLKHHKKLLCFYLPIKLNSIIKRVEGRYVCENCGKNYNIYFYPPKKKFICDICGAKLVKRSDDTEEVIRKRYALFQQETMPVIKEFKKNKNIAFFEIDAEKSINEIFNYFKNIIYDQVKKS